MKVETNLLLQILECGYLDVRYFIDLLQNNKIDLDIEDIRTNYGELNVNILIYDVMRTIAENFISENQEEICSILELGEG